MKSLQTIEAEVNRLARLIGAMADELPTYGYTRDFGYPHIEVDWTHYHYVVVERGEELERKSTTDFEELLYWIFRTATSKIAFAYELANRVENQDCRRVAFPKQVELLNRISPRMAAKCQSEIDGILREYPYDDDAIRALNGLRGPNGT